MKKSEEITQLIILWNGHYVKCKLEAFEKSIELVQEMQDENKALKNEIAKLRTTQDEIYKEVQTGIEQIKK